MVAQVIVDVSSSEVDKIFEYNVPENMGLESGYRVQVPFGNRVIEGYVLSLSDEKSTSHELKNIIKKSDDIPVMTKEQLALARYMKLCYHLRMVDIIHLFIPSRSQSKPKVETIYFLKEGVDTSKIKIRANAVKQKDFLNDISKREISQTQINALYGNSVLKFFTDMDILEKRIVRNYRQPTIYEKQKKEVILTPEQAAAVDKINSDNRTKVLFGVTGSGKTEVYIKAIEKVLNEGKTAIMLVPEISLTPQTMANFKSRFGDNIALIHSALSVGERYDEWDKILTGQVKIVVGVRSAIFSPLKNVGLIIIDEEHDSSYFSESNPRYSTHEVAKFRSVYNTCPLVLGSATPSVDTMYKVKNGDYDIIKMLKRVNDYPLPKIEIVNMLDELRVGNNNIFSKKFIQELKNTVSLNQQAMILINRRGYQSTLRCGKCGYVAKCQRCDVALVYHKDENLLKCHYCNMRYHTLTNCPVCDYSNFRYGAIGTEKVVGELEKIFPDVPILRMDNDTTRGKDGHNKILEEFREKSPAILVGTQMIAKGHDYPLVTFVGVIDTDAGLYYSDYRATEKTFSLIVQVAGRAGRAGNQGRVILQTNTPKASIFKTIIDYDYDRFYDNELKTRKLTYFPPYTKMIRVLITSEDAAICEKVTHNLYNEFFKLKKDFGLDSIVYLDYMKSPVKKIQDKYRYQILFRLNENASEIIEKIYDIVDDNRQKNCTIFTEINPQSLQ